MSSRRISPLLGGNWPAAFAGHPFAAQFAHEVERTGDENYVFGRGEFEGARQGFRGAGHDFRAPRMVGRHFSESLRVLYDGPRGCIIFVKFGVVGGIAVRKIDRGKHRLEVVSPGIRGIEVLQAGSSYLS
jgi:hypothetical protein